MGENVTGLGVVGGTNTVGGAVGAKVGARVTVGGAVGAKVGAGVTGGGACVIAVDPVGEQLKQKHFLLVHSLQQ